jgi:hypothetical protein
MKKLINNHKALCIILFALGWVDCLMTVFGLANHKGYEANPAMAWVLTFGYGAFIWVKMSITGLVCYLLYRFSPGVSWSLRLIQAVNVIYVLVAIYQIIGLSFS